MTDIEPTNETPTAETAIASDKRSHTRKIIFATIGALLIIIVAAVIASKAGLDKALVRQQLDAIALQLKERGAAQGRDVTFTYGDIAIKGGFTNKHAVISAPQLDIRPMEGEGFEQHDVKEGKPNTLRITSPVLEVFPESANLSELKFALPQPVDFASIEEPEKSLLKVRAATPLELHYATLKQKGAPYTRWQFTAPASLDLDYLREQVVEGEEDATPVLKPVYDTLNVAMEKGTAELTLAQGGSGLGQGTLEFKSIAMAPASQPEAGKVTIAQILGQWSNQRNEKNLNVVNSTFSIDRVEAAEELIPYAPISLALDFTYEGAMPSTPEEVAAISSQESSLKLKTLSLSTKDASFDATADFVATPEDRLPVGMATVNLTNLPFVIAELKENGLIAAEDEGLLVTILEQVTGVAYDELKDVTLDVQRTRGGSFQIGKTTFEELFATILQAALSNKAPAPKLPEKQTPVEPEEAPADQHRG